MKDFIKDKEGRIIFLTPEKFREQIIEKKGCFICAASRKEVAFNNEHIFPKWKLDEFQMHQAKIDLPNKEKHQYGTYVVPCCVTCNSRMGSEIEKPISDLLKGGYKSVYKFMSDGDPRLLYCWLARIFLKTHLKDSVLRKHLDSRQGPGNIGDDYIWENLYLPFCFSRAFYAGTTSLENIMGSFIVVPITDNKNDLTNRWYYTDDSNGLTLVLQIRDMGFIASFGDFGISLGSMEKMFEKINNRPVNPSQLGQLGAYVSATNLVYRNRPTVFFDTETNSFVSVPPENTVTKKPSDDEWGNILYHFTHKLIVEKDVAEEVKAGKRQFLWDNKGEFIATHL